MKIEIFKDVIRVGDKPSEIQQQVNEFIKDKKVIDIKQSTTAFDNGGKDHILVIMVLYED